jgi:hypothetical protein
VCGELCADDSFDVFEEDELGSTLDDAFEDVGKEVSGIFVSTSFSGKTEGLAREAARKDVHESRKRAPWEGLKIRPDRCRIQLSLFNLRNQIGASEGFDLAKSDCAQTSDNSFESEINASVSGAKADVCNVLGSIHVIIGSGVN